MAYEQVSQMNFFSEISERQTSVREFFSETLIESIARNFGFKKVLICYFDTEGNLLSCVRRSGSLVKHDQEAFAHFIIKDQVCEKIYIDAIRDSLTYFNVEPRLYKSTDIILTDYDHSTYVSFIKKYYDAYYTTTMAFGINAYIKLIFFKSFDEGDFTQEEIEELNKIYVYVANSYKNFKKHEQMKIVSHIQSQIIALDEKAYVIVDYFMNAMSYNQMAEDYLKEVFGMSIVKQLNSQLPCHWITVLLELKQDNTSITKTCILKNYLFTVHTYNQSYSNGIIDRYYWITISKNDVPKTIDLTCSLQHLTQTEQKVAELMYSGLTYKAIAKELVVSYHTVKKHVENIYTKCGVKSRFQLSKWLENQNVIK